MIRATIFDLDGTLVQTEALKAESYARAAVELRPHDLKESDVIAAYDDMVGRSRNEVARALMTRFGLEQAAAARMRELGAGSPADAYIALRLRIYEAMIADRRLLRAQEYTHATALLRRARAMGFPIGVATMSHLAQARVVLEVLELRDAIDVLVTRDDVDEPKPSPEIYLLTAERLHVSPADCFVLEDSVPGICSALAAGMACVALTNDMTRDAVHAAHLLPPERIVDDGARLARVALPLLEEQGVGRSATPDG